MFPILVLTGNASSIKEMGCNREYVFKSLDIITYLF